MGSGPQLTIGAVVPETGRLARLGDPMSFVLGALAPRLPPVRDGDRRYGVRVAIRDSRSEPSRARQAVRELVEVERASVIITMAGTQVLPVVAETCEILRVPCVSTTFPWQAYLHTRAVDAVHRFRWTYHFAWGLDDIANVFADMWERLGGRQTVGCLWNDDLQGRLLRRHFAPVAIGRGHTLVDPGGYREPATDLCGQLDHLHRHGADIVTSAATAADLALYYRQATQTGPRPRLITCSRWLTYPHAGTAHDAGPDLAEARVATLVYWTPRHPHRSSLDDVTAADLAASYQRATGRPWLQPLGLAHALVEVAHHALTSAADPAEPSAVAEAIGRTRLATIAGLLDWTSGPTPNIALLPLIGGQWISTRKGHELAVVTNTAAPDIPIAADLTPAHP
ncbi:ABC transporter substrate-binding protein [Nonomuraea sp. K274]|uniref:ABC transporter substrate-binding protein n=1 Tax=Nonomuraea cypriaca TaxID=1187855 RepID=A0A931F3A6_9ACTN|nr:ABC transporter substrate-binding protein [Nonomuraea cypriaca]MBF8189548.1 ABC transporter substrate-binding protein [Nonomuraea cypriaca]